MRCNNKAFTVMELIITIFIMAMISIPLYFVLSDSTSQANVIAARNHIKQEGNKVYKILENDLTQAKRESFSQKDNTFSIRVRLQEKDDKLIKLKEDEDPELKYTFEKPKLYRSLQGKRWLVSDSVDSIEVIEPSEIEKKDSPGKLTVNLVMKSNLPGIKENDQPKYEQNKIIVMAEDAASVNDPNWIDIGRVGGIFQTDGNILASLKEDFEKLGSNFMDEWEKTFADVKNMTIGQLKEALTNAKDNLAKLQDQIKDMNGQIKDLSWDAIYERTKIKEKKFLGITTGTNEKQANKENAEKERRATEIKNFVASIQNASEMHWETVKQKGGSDMKAGADDALTKMFDAKNQMFDGEQKMKDGIAMIENEINSK